MPATLAVPESMLTSVSAFVEAEGITLNVVAGDTGTVQVVQTRERLESSPSVLQSGGWISCGMARSMAAKLDMSSRGIGKLLNHLDIRIRDCELGCFE